MRYLNIIKTLFFTNNLPIFLHRTHVVISNNSSLNSGGGVFCFDFHGGKILNSTLVNNHCKGTNVNSGGGGLYLGISDQTILNTIIWGNKASNENGNTVLLFDDHCDPTFRSCIIEGGINSVKLNSGIFLGDNEGILDKYPIFNMPSDKLGAIKSNYEIDWSLKSNSPAIDIGVIDSFFYYKDFSDIIGNPRISVCNIDIGAFEFTLGSPFDFSFEISEPILCYGSQGSIKVNAQDGKQQYKYLWSFGDTIQEVQNLSAGEYSVTVTELGFGCSKTKSIILTEPSKITINGGTDKTIICGDKVQLDSVIVINADFETITYSWSPSQGINDTTSSHPIVRTTEDATYVLTVKTSNGCIAKDTVSVFVTPIIVSIDDVVSNCGDSIQFHLTSNIILDDSVKYQWNPLYNLNSNTIANPTAFIDTSINYCVEIISGHLKPTDY